MCLAWTVGTLTNFLYVLGRFLFFGTPVTSGICGGIYKGAFGTRQPPCIGNVTDDGVPVSNGVVAVTGIIVGNGLGTKYVSAISVLWNNTRGAMFCKVRGTVAFAVSVRVS